MGATAEREGYKGFTVFLLKLHRETVWLPFPLFCVCLHFFIKKKWLQRGFYNTFLKWLQGFFSFCLQCVSINFGFTVKRPPSNVHRQTSTVKRPPSNVHRQTSTVSWDFVCLLSCVSVRSSFAIKQPHLVSCVLQRFIYIFCSTAVLPGNGRTNYTIIREWPQFTPWQNGLFLIGLDDGHGLFFVPVRDRGVSVCSISISRLKEHQGREREVAHRIKHSHTKKKTLVVHFVRVWIAKKKVGRGDFWIKVYICSVFVWPLFPQTFHSSICFYKYLYFLKIIYYIQYLSNKKDKAALKKLLLAQSNI